MFAIALMALAAPSKLKAQSYGPTVDTCNFNAVDWSNDVEQTVCLYGDATELDASVDTDSWAYGDSNFPSGDLYVVGLGAQGQVRLTDGNLVTDTGMSQSGPYGYLVQANQQMPDATNGTSITPQLNVWYSFNGSYSECYDSSGTGSDSCSWTGPLQGLYVQAMITSTKLTPTVTVSSSAAPSVYQNPVVLTAELQNEPDLGYVQFYDGSNSLGTAYINQVSIVNLVPYSQQFNQSTWGGYCGATSNMVSNTTDVSAPDGSSTATKFTIPTTIACDGSQPGWGVLTTIPGGLQVGQTYTASIWMKGANGGENVGFGMNDCAFGGVTLTNSWKRYTATYPTIPAHIADCSDGSRGFQVAAGGAPGATFYVWGAQTEQAPSAGTYVPTGANPAAGIDSQARIITNSLDVGSHSITVSYLGDLNTYPATSDPFTQIVNPITYDSGSVTLTVNGTSQSASFGQTSTPASIAHDLANAFTQANDPDVTVNAYGSLLTITGKQAGAGSDYAYSVSATYNSGVFYSPSFGANPPWGVMAGGGTNVQLPIYSYNAAGGYDANGNVLEYSDSVMGDWQFTYDDVNRLVTAANVMLPSPGPLTVPAPSWGAYFCWAYDGFGNRLQQATSDQPITSGNGTCALSSSGTNIQNVLSTFNSQNQMTSTNAPGISWSPSYDGAGDVIDDGSAGGGHTYLYDAEGRICASSTLGGTATGYLYDASGNRVAKGTITSWSCDITVNGFTQTAGYVVDGGGQQLTEVDASNNWRHTNIWANGKQIGTYDSAGLHFYFDDPLGTRRAQANSSGVLEAVYQSLPFGDDLVSSGPAADPTENHFTGKEHDAETGNDYMFARYYNSATGRFLSPDWDAKSDDPVPYAKLADPQSLNLYSYVENSPLDKEDADGHQSAGTTAPPVPDTVVGPSTPGYNVFLNGVEKAIEFPVVETVGVVTFLFTAGVQSTGGPRYDMLHPIPSPEEHKADPEPQVASGGRLRGGGITNSNRGIYYTNDLYHNLSPGQRNTVDIQYTGSRKADFAAANKEAGFSTTPKDYTWHHLDNYNATTNKGTMQLVRTSTHRSTSHWGGVRQYEKAKKTDYKP